MLSPRQVVNLGVCWILEMSVREPEAASKRARNIDGMDPWVLDYSSYGLRGGSHPGRPRF